MQALSFSFDAMEEGLSDSRAEMNMSLPPVSNCLSGHIPTSNSLNEWYTKLGPVPERHVLPSFSNPCCPTGGCRRGINHPSTPCCFVQWKKKGQRKDKWVGSVILRTFFQLFSEQCGFCSRLVKTELLNFGVCHMMTASPFCY